MKFAVISCLIALAATVVCSQPLYDTVQQSHRPSPPVKYLAEPPVLTLVPQSSQPNPEVMDIAHVRPDIPEAIVNIIENFKHKPELDYFNGKVVPTPKYPTILNSN